MTIMSFFFTRFQHSFLMVLAFYILRFQHPGIRNAHIYCGFIDQMKNSSIEHIVEIRDGFHETYCVDIKWPK